VVIEEGLWRVVKSKDSTVYRFATYQSKNKDKGKRNSKGKALLLKGWVKLHNQGQEGYVHLIDKTKSHHAMVYHMHGGRAPAEYFYHLDHLGTPQVMTDSEQAVVWQASYAPFGQATMSTEQIDNDLRFPGQYFDQESGLHYNYYRYYDPVTGRYITSDPIGLEGGLNTYAYVGGNPSNNVDPQGLFFWDILDFSFFAQSLYEFSQCSSAENAFNLGLDAVGLLPGIPALGTLRRVGDVPNKTGKELQTYWPVNNGALGKVKNEQLQSGTVIDRYGHEGGSYVSPAGTPFEMRALPPTTNRADLNTYRVVKPVKAETAIVAPAFNQIGLGTQHKLSESVGNLIKSGHLERIK
jgi:RHS repeat-associated protein